MRRYRIPITISLLIHCILLAFLFLLWEKPEPGVKTIRMLFEIEESQQQTNTIKKTQDIGEEKKIATFPESLFHLKEPEHRPTMIPERKPTWRDIVRKELNKSQDRKTVPTQILQPVSPLKSLVLKDVQKNDWIADEIRKRELGTTLLLFNPILQTEKEKEIPVQFNFIPSEAQLQSLRQLYEKGKVSQLELYPNLLLSRPITAEDFDKSLEMLVKKGFVTRKKISPENILYVQGIPIELSSKNRKNPVYLYTANIDKNQTITYLQARLYQLKEEMAASMADSLKLRNKILDLNKKIQILIQN